MPVVVTTGAVKLCKAAVKSSSPTTNQHPTVYRPDVLPVAQPTVSELCKGNNHYCPPQHNTTVQSSLFTANQTLVLLNFSLAASTTAAQVLSAVVTNKQAP